MTNMHDAVVEKFGAPLVLREMPIPTPGSGQIVIKTEACGVWHTDFTRRAWRLARKAHSPVRSRP